MKWNKVVIRTTKSMSWKLLSVAGHLDVMSVWTVTVWAASCAFLYDAAVNGRRRTDTRAGDCYVYGRIQSHN